MSKSSPDPESAPPRPFATHGGSSPSVNRLEPGTGGLTKRTGIQHELTEKNTIIDNREESMEEGSKPVYDYTHRTLKPRHVQLIGIGGTIGTALYVQIGQTLAKGGPGSLFLAFTIWCCVILCITVCTVPFHLSPVLHRRQQPLRPKRLVRTSSLPCARRIQCLLPNCSHTSYFFPFDM
ncbi:hypothetical protein BDW59DRAFT_77647 [Aspergillus cavernicola]|uniref:Amino acid permease/ SLC12A domain-containing protein n=1 Tax=Aspergillus cavernicola TaxID=176166 RepID=A0ABR4IZQ7_9EURO